MSNIPKGYLSVLLEEIALEGLDGITLESIASVFLKFYSLYLNTC